MNVPFAIDYPSSDGQPMSDNTVQFRWITKLQGGFDALFRHDPNVFVAGDLFWVQPVSIHLDDGLSGSVFAEFCLAAMGSQPQPWVFPCH